MSKKEYSKVRIIEIVKGFIGNHAIMFMYYCGSIAYGVADSKSDIDVSVVVADLNGTIHMQLGGLDLFIYGADTYLKKQKLKDDIPLYFKMHIDDVVDIDKNLIYLDENYLSEYKTYKDIKLEENLKSFLNCFIEHYTLRGKNHTEPAKTLYHVFRLRGLLDHFDRVGKHEMIIEEPWKSKLLEFKQNWNNHIVLSYMPEIVRQLEYIKNYKDRI